MPRTRARRGPGAGAPAERAPRVGFVSLGCPKALVDSERILTQLRAEGYEVAPTYEAADLVVVNTCGFIDAAIDESLDAIGEALSRCGRVIVTGCLGARPERIHQRLRLGHPLRAGKLARRELPDALHRPRPRTRGARRLGTPALRLSLSARRPGDPADGGTARAPLSRYSLSAREPLGVAPHAPPGACRGHARAHPPLARRVPRTDAPQHLHRRLPRVH